MDNLEPYHLLDQPQAISVGFEFTPEMLAGIEIQAEIPPDELEQAWDALIERGTE